MKYKVLEVDEALPRNKWSVVFESDDIAECESELVEYSKSYDWNTYTIIF